MKSPSRLRLMPVVMTAAGALLALKAIGLATHTSYLFVPAAKAETAQEQPAAPAPGQPAPPEKHGTEEEAKAPGQTSDAAARPRDKPAPAADDPSPSERALLEALQKRRETLDARANDLDMREALLKAAEKRLDERLDELKRVEQAVADVDKRRVQEEQSRLKSLVVMYEAMKVKEAAAIFDKLDGGVLLDVASMMKPQKLSEIMGRMSPETAQRLTVSLARRDPVPAPSAALAAGDLPKIEGH